MNTTNRIEHKYVISYVDYLKIIGPLRSVLLPDPHSTDGAYEVNSLYFDDIHNSGAMDKAFGTENHSKFRIRSYDGFNTYKLEQKNKKGDETTKYSSFISTELYKALLEQDNDTMYKYIENQLLCKFMVHHNQKYLTPRCFIKYQREAFYNGSDNFRLTFDHQLETTYYDQEVKGDYLQILPSTSVVLEVKYTHYIPKPVQTILNTIKLDKISYSKYFMGYQQLTY